MNSIAYFSTSEISITIVQTIFFRIFFFFFVLFLLLIGMMSRDFGLWCGLLHFLLSFVIWHLFLFLGLALRIVLGLFGKLLLGLRGLFFIVTRHVRFAAWTKMRGYFRVQLVCYFSETFKNILINRHPINNQINKISYIYKLLNHLTLLSFSEWIPAFPFSFLIFLLVFCRLLAFVLLFLFCRVIRYLSGIVCWGFYTKFWFLVRFLWVLFRLLTFIRSFLIFIA